MTGSPRRTATADEAYDASTAPSRSGSTRPAHAIDEGLAHRPGPWPARPVGLRRAGHPRPARRHPAAAARGTGRQVTTSSCCPPAPPTRATATASGHHRPPPPVSARRLHPLLAGAGSWPPNPSATRSASVVDQSLLLPLRLQVLHAGCCGDPRPPRVDAINDPLRQAARCRRRRAHRHARPRVPGHRAQRGAQAVVGTSRSRRLRPRRLRADQRRRPGHGTGRRPQHPRRHQPARRRRGVAHLPRGSFAHRHHRVARRLRRRRGTTPSPSRAAAPCAHRPRRAHLGRARSPAPTARGSSPLPHLWASNDAVRADGRRRPWRLGAGHTVAGVDALTWRHAERVSATAWRRWSTPGARRRGPRGSVARHPADGPAAAAGTAAISMADW